MFWGLIMEPNKRYTQVVEKPFHISQAAMDISTGDNDPCQVMVVVDGKNFLACTLQKNRNIQVPLDLYFKSGDAVSFLTNGKCNVHLTGYLDPEFEEDEESSGGEEEDEDEVPTLVSAAKRKLENSNEKNASKKLKKEKKAAKGDSSDSEDEEEDQLQKILDGEDLDTDDNDESFKINASAEASDSEEEEESDDEEEAEDKEGEDEEVEDESSEEADTTLDTTLDTSKEEAKVDTSKLSKSARRRLKKKLQKEGKEPQVNGVDKPKKGAKGEQQQKEKKKPEAKKEVQENGVAEKKEKKTISGGVSIEDLKVGNGPAAKPGKNVMVYYEGRLKSNNKMFDNCLKGPGFKFRLGAKEVITGWDVGISGMKVGGKRRITCPPNMAYGAKGSPPVIPPNSTLVFEVELKNVK